MDEHKGRGGYREGSGNKSKSIDGGQGTPMRVSPTEKQIIAKLREADEPTRRSFLDWLLG
jgi:hypothetical protein